MKPILHIIRNSGDEQAIEIIRKQAMDNAYGVIVIFIHNIESIPSIPNVRVCILKEDIEGRTTLLENISGAELIDYNDMLNKIFSVESITVW